MSISENKQTLIQFHLNFHHRVGEKSDGDLGHRLQKGTEKPPAKVLDGASVVEGIKNVAYVNDEKVPIAENGQRIEAGESGKSIKDALLLRMCVIEWLRV